MRERLKSNVRIASGCWEWTGARAGRGYGVTSYRDDQFYAHRASWILFCGVLPDGLCVLHRCDNPPCINPDHLWIGSYKDNSRDAVSKHRLVGNRTWGETKPVAKLTASDVIDIRRRYDAGERIIDIRKSYSGVTWQNIKAVAVRKTWRRLPEVAA